MTLWSVGLSGHLVMALQRIVSWHCDHDYEQQHVRCLSSIQNRVPRRSFGLGSEHVHRHVRFGFVVRERLKPHTADPIIIIIIIISNYKENDLWKIWPTNKIN